MTPARVLVTGARGNAGREVVQCLLRRGQRVRAASRGGTDARDDTVAFDFADPAGWDAALEGIDAVFLMRPPAISDMSGTLLPFIARARARGVRQIVFLSVEGADRSALVPHHAVERALIGGPPGWTILRPGFFAQNLADAYVRDIREDRRLYVPAGRGKVAFVDLRDVAEVAADALTRPASHAGQAHALTGPRAVDMAEVAALLRAATGQPIRYVAASMAGYIRHLRRRGLGWGAVMVQTYLHVGLRFGQARRVEPTLGRLLGRPATDIAAYVADHAALWKSPG